MELANELQVIDPDTELKRQLTDCQLVPMYEPVSRLLLNLNGLEDYVETEQHFPHIEMMAILFRLQHSDADHRLKQFVHDVSRMEAFHYRARSLGGDIRNWDPLNETFESFITLPHVFVWEHYERYPVALVIERWMLRHSMRLACVNPEFKTGAENG